MVKKRQLTVEDRQTIVDLKREGLSCREIAKKVQVSVNAVSYTVKRHSETGGNWDRNRSGRPKATTKMEDKFLRITSRRNEKLTAQQLRAQLNLGRRKQVSLSTVKRRLNAAGLSSWVSVGKPLLKVQMKKKVEPSLKVQMKKKKVEEPSLKVQLKKKKPLQKVQEKEEEPFLKVKVVELEEEEKEEKKQLGHAIADSVPGSSVTLKTTAGYKLISIWTN
ncbi:hypothetical protein AB205_0200290 [Aquarana catesbeiana]|uniref:Transposase IS30-like HTH domain-containing protein n=1 Tax=Aquarana catesbeiana TaxID=8400 RepID=A0A2G9RCP9_AQUCT|nr:hypothetical protein AB205_0200290 [Aquarana catesbeiana]